jgi:threonine aldolase
VRHPDPAFDLRSDAITLPTDEMGEAMRSVRPGWPVPEDETVHRLERVGAELSGKEACAFVPTGGMGNLVALMSHTRRGDQLVLEAASHILWAEEWGFAYVCGLAPRPIDTLDGVLSPEQVEAEIVATRFGFASHTSLVCLENTHNGCGGTVVDAAQTAAVCAVAHAHGVAVHVDGARILNACAALGVDLASLVADADSLMLNLNKGLSAPFGALVCGSAAFIERCRLALRRLGAANFHQAGMLAAAGVVALETMPARLAQDNARARMLADRLRRVRGLECDPERVQTNIVMARLDPERATSAELAAHLRTRGIGALPYTETILRFVTHRHVTDAVVERIAVELEQHLGTEESHLADTVRIR